MPRHAQEGLPLLPTGGLFVGAETDKVGESPTAAVVALPPGADDDVLTVVEGAPAWAAPSPPSGASGVAPGAISGLAFHLRPEELAALADGAAISSWADAGPDGRNVAQATGASKPTYRANALNGHGAADFDGGDLLTLAGSAVAGATGLTILAVARLDAVGNYPHIVSWANYNLRFNAGAGTLEFNTPDGSPAPSTRRFDDAAWRTYAGILAPLWEESYADGELYGQSGTPSGMGFAGGDLVIGAHTSADFFLTGRIAELAVFKRPLLAREVRNILAGWDTKFHV